MAEKFAKMQEKMRDMFIKIMEPLMPIIDGLMMIGELYMKT